MDDRDNQNSGSGQTSDMSKSQTPQQPQGETKQGDEYSQSQDGQLSEADSPSTTGERSQSDPSSDVEGASASGQANTSSAFVGSQGSSDSSSELIEDEDKTDFAKDGQGAPE